MTFGALNTAASCDACRYKPITSAALLSKSGSLEARWPSSRCGWMPCLAQMRATVMCETWPNSAASFREDQCVEPSRVLVFGGPG
jgi:hypothetical protein